MVAAVAQVQTLAQELLHAVGVAKKNSNLPNALYFYLLTLATLHPANLNNYL